MAESKNAGRDCGKQDCSEKSKGIAENLETDLAEEARRSDAIPECAVCLQTCVHPARLPCSHIFCFLCLKGLATQSRRCAMCRQEIPHDYLDHPQLLEEPTTSEKEAFEDGYQWFYEGRSGWWQYDERTSRELEAAFKSGQRSCELLIVGQLYIADFDAMLQLRRNDMSRRRRIKRDLASIPIKGIAGLRLDGLPPDQASSSQDELLGTSLDPLLYHPRDTVCRGDALRDDSDEEVNYANVEGEASCNSDTTDVEAEVDSSEEREYDEDENDRDDLAIEVSQLHNLWLG